MIRRVWVGEVEEAGGRHIVTRVFGVQSEALAWAKGCEDVDSSVGDRIWSMFEADVCFVEDGDD